LLGAGARARSLRLGTPCQLAGRTAGCRVSRRVFSGAMSRRGDWEKISAQYEVSEVIGSGYFGTVVLARDATNNRMVAVQRFSQLSNEHGESFSHIFDDLDLCMRVLRDVAILQKLQHQSVLQIYDIVANKDMETFDALFIVKELCDVHLRCLLRMDVQLEPQHIFSLLYNLLAGVKYVHSAGICHCDLKPSSCLVNKDCSVKIKDFGLSRSIETPSNWRPNAFRRTAKELPLTQDCVLKICDFGVLEDLQIPPCVDLPSSPRGGGVRRRRGAIPRCLCGAHVDVSYRAPELLISPPEGHRAVDVWAVGCIYAELLGMLEGARTEDRSPLFGQLHGRKSVIDKIFNLLGTPSDEDVEGLECEDAKRYLRGITKRAGHGLQSKFPHVDSKFVALLDGMLKFNPKFRIGAEKALEDPIFSELRNPSIETAAADVITFDFEKGRDLDEAELRRCFSLEIRKCHPEAEEHKRAGRGGA